LLDERGRGTVVTGATDGVAFGGTLERVGFGGALDNTEPRAGFGGALDNTEGRVGSAFDDAGGRDDRGFGGTLASAGA
jgi:hypothetical protein